MTEYITNADYRRQKSALTRAINSGDPLKVLDTVEKTLDEWHGKAWPDAWSRWRNAVEDAFGKYDRDPARRDEPLEISGTNIDRFRDCLGRFF